MAWRTEPDKEFWERHNNSVLSASLRRLHELLASPAQTPDRFGLTEYL